MKNSCIHLNFNEETKITLNNFANKSEIYLSPTLLPVPIIEISRIHLIFNAMQVKCIFDVVCVNNSQRQQVDKKFSHDVHGEYLSFAREGTWRRNIKSYDTKPKHNIRT